MKYQSIDVNPVSGALGAEIHGVQISNDINNSRVMSDIHDAFLQYGVLFFRDQEMTSDMHVAFGKKFGPLHVHPAFEPFDKKYPEILRIVKTKEDKINIGNAWHYDVTHEECPPLGSILYARETPQYGGDTMFSNMYAAYDALSTGMKRMIDGLMIVHSGEAAFGKLENVESRFNTNHTGMKAVVSDDLAFSSEHPAVRTHPETGRKCLFVNRHYTSHLKDMSKAESRPVLDYLYRHAERPEFTCRFRWRKDSIAFWDNRCVQHYAINDYQGVSRVMHRVTIQGDRPV